MEVLAMKQSDNKDSSLYVSSLILTFTFSSGFFMLMPGILGGIADHLGYSNQQIGWVASAEMMGMFFGAIATYFTTVYVEPKITIFFGLLGLMIGNLVSAYLLLTPDAITFFLALRFATGIFGGLALTTCISLIGRTSDPERNCGLMVASQLCLAMSGLYFLPLLFDMFGIAAAFNTLALLAVLSIVFLSLFPKRSFLVPVEKDKNSPLFVFRNKKLLSLFLAIFIFFCAQGGIWAYLDRIGVASNLSPQQVGSYLALGKIFGIVGSIFGVLIAVRFGRVKPFSLAILSSVLSMLLLHKGGSPLMFVLGVSLFNFGWCLALPYFFGLQASLDKTGRSMSIYVTMQTLGVAVGPGLVSIFLQGDGLAGVIIYGVICFVLCGLITLPIMKKSSLG